MKSLIFFIIICFNFSLVDKQVLETELYNRELLSIERMKNHIDYHAFLLTREMQKRSERRVSSFLSFEEFTTKKYGKGFYHLFLKPCSETTICTVIHHQSVIKI